jgi:aspartate 1-decarboxylase
MSREQTVELLKFVAENGNDYDYWIIDSYWYNELQIEHLTLFAPSVIVFDGNNEVLFKIEYEEKMLAQLTDYFNNNKH